MSNILYFKKQNDKVR